MIEFVVTLIQTKSFTNRETGKVREYYKVWFALPSEPGKDPDSAWLYSNIRPKIGSKIRVGFRPSSNKDNDGMAQLYIVN